MSAGESARLEAEASARQAQELHLAARNADVRSRNFAKGGAAEERVARLLGELTAYDVHVVNDRRWPGTRSANIDHLVIGTSGVFVVDTKDWSQDLRVSEDDLFRGQTSCAEDLDSAQRMADAVREELVDEGLAPSQVIPVMAFVNRSMPPTLCAGIWLMAAEEVPRFVLRRGKLFTQHQVEQLLGRLLAACPSASTAATTTPTDRLGHTDMEADAATDDAMISRDELEDAALEAALRAPLADWMTFLHPEQARLVGRSLAGPSRISGPAGTGKSVVALHRLAYLAERRRSRLLYVRFMKTVPRVLAQAYGRLSPHTTGRVDFMSLHSWAFGLVRDRRGVRTVDQLGIEDSFKSAWAAVGRGSVLDKTAAASYWKEEVDRVVRGRDLRSIDAYLDLDRVGRGSRLGSQQRRAVWTLVEAYEAELQRRRLHDWNDILRMARDEVRRRPLDPAYDVVVLDEAQDMPLLAAELLHAIAGDKPDGLLLVGDDQQRVFPGGFRLTEAGIDVTGRSTRLTRNYRNTQEILRAARSLVAGEDDDLLEGGRGSNEVEVRRSGSEPVFVRAAARGDHDSALLSHLQTTLRSTLARPGEVAILVERTRHIEDYCQRLRGCGVTAVELSEWDGVRADAVVVGTNKSAKGLEFKHVLVPLVDPILMQSVEPPDEYDAEQWRQRRRELYVAMTRARDSLWIGCVAIPRQAKSTATPHLVS